MWVWACGTLSLSWEGRASQLCPPGCCLKQCASYLIAPARHNRRASKLAVGREGGKQDWFSWRPDDAYCYLRLDTPALALALRAGAARALLAGFTRQQWLHRVSRVLRCVTQCEGQAHDSPPEAPLLYCAPSYRATVLLACRAAGHHAPHLPLPGHPGCGHARAHPALAVSPCAALRCGVCRPRASQPEVPLFWSMQSSGSAVRHPGGGAALLWAALGLPAVLPLRRPRQACLLPCHANGLPMATLPYHLPRHQVEMHVKRHALRVAVVVDGEGREHVGPCRPLLLSSAGCLAVISAAFATLERRPFALLSVAA